MILTLEVTGANAPLLGTASRKVFAGEGGSIGRLPSNAWCLQDSHVSKQHARISVDGDTFFLEDTNSANGVVLNAQKLQAGRRYPLNDGDRIFIDPFEIRVSLSAGAGASAGIPESLDVFDLSPGPPRPARATPNPFAGLGGLDDLIPASSADSSDANPSPTGDSVINRIVGTPPAPPRREPPRAAELELKSVLEDPMPLPPVVREADRDGGFAIPPNYVPGSGDSQALRPAPGHPSRRRDPSGAFPKPTPAAGARPTRSPARRGADLPERAGPDDSQAGLAAAPARSAAPPEGFINLAETLRAAGLENVPVTPELAQRFGEILRAVVAGLIDTLQVRNSIRDEFRMRHTSYPAGKRNPLKVSVDVDDALHNLLVKRNAAYLEPVAAVEDAFADVRYHQMAMLAGMREAFDAMLAAFDPKRLEEQFDGMKRGALVSVPAKLRYWELYREKFDGMVSDADRCFQDLFAAEFTAAYEEQLARLKAQHGAPGRGATS